MKKGAFIISLDTELGWGEFDLGKTEKKRDEYLLTRQCIESMILLFEKYNINATFAIVGHLMLNDIEYISGVKYPEITRPTYIRYTKDWFDHVSIHADERSIWFGRDILDRIIDSSVKHEIASHSFSHIIFGEDGCTRNAAESDIAKCVKIADSLMIKLESFVFPRNSIKYEEILLKYDFKTYRTNGTEWYKKIKIKFLRRFAHIIDDVFSITPSTHFIKRDLNGLYTTEGSMLYLSRNGVRKLIPIHSRVTKAKKGIDAAIKKNQVFHLWFHPHNIASDPKKLLMGFEEILKYAKAKIDANELINMTMKEIPEYYKLFNDKSRLKYNKK